MVLRKWCLLAVCLPILAGCEEEHPIRQYTIDRPADTHRMIGAIITTDRETWFFKLTGPIEQVEQVKSQVDALLNSIHFRDGKPEWTLPEGWTEQPASGMRFATLLSSADTGRLELTVSSLQAPPENQEDFVTMNVQRWQRQLGLPATPRSSWEALSRQIPIGDQTAWVVEFSGRLSGNGMMASAPPANRASPEAAPPATARPEIGYKLPEGWKVAPQDQFSLLAFEAGSGAQAARVTITRAAGQLQANINRWAGQVGRAPLSAREMQELVTTVPVGTETGRFIVLEGPEQTILGIIVQQSAVSWFIKLRGEKAIAENEKENFLAFAASLQLP